MISSSFRNIFFVFLGPFLVFWAQVARQFKVFLPECPAIVEIYSRIGLNFILCVAFWIEQD